MEEVEEEVEAVKAVYGRDCTILSTFPPHIHITLKPRTADDISQQFVEAVLIIKANMQYPAEPPIMELKDTKGLDEERHKQLIALLRSLASEMAHSPMLISICETAVDQLTNMNHPEGNCCFCMYPLVVEDAQSESRPFMKLLSCFHCFHSDCFARWWRWQLEQQIKDLSGASNSSTQSEQDDEQNSSNANPSICQDASLEKLMERLQVKCPICRKDLHADDVAHVERFLTIFWSLQKDHEDSTSVPTCFLTSEELARREHFSRQYKVQQSRGGIIEPRKLEVLMPGMFITPATCSSVVSQVASQEGEEATCNAESYESPAESGSMSDQSEQISVSRISCEQASRLSQPHSLNSSGRTRYFNFREDHHREGGRYRKGQHTFSKVRWIKRERDTDC